MEWVEIIGWVAVLATITTYAVRTMLPLRLLALLANLFFLIYGALAPIYPTMVMYALLLPINLYRIYDIQRTTRQMKDIKPDEKAFEWLRPLLKPARMLDGAYVFREGDPANRFFVMLTGEVLLEQTDVTLKGSRFSERLGSFLTISNALFLPDVSALARSCPLMRRLSCGYSIKTPRSGCICSNSQPADCWKVYVAIQMPCHSAACANMIPPERRESWYMTKPPPLPMPRAHPRLTTAPELCGHKDCRAFAMLQNAPMLLRAHFEKPPSSLPSVTPLRRSFSP